MIDAVVIRKAYITACVSAIAAPCGQFLPSSCMICYTTVYHFLKLFVNNCFSALFCFIISSVMMINMIYDPTLLLALALLHRKLPQRKFNFVFFLCSVFPPYLNHEFLIKKLKICFIFLNFHLILLSPLLPIIIFLFIIFK